MTRRKAITATLAVWVVCGAAAFMPNPLGTGHANGTGDSQPTPQAVETEWTYLVGWVYADGEWSYYPGRWVLEG